MRSFNYRAFPQINDSVIFLIIIILCIAIRSIFFDWPMISDEGGYAYTANWWFKGLTLYSDDLWFDRPQGIFIAYKLGMIILGGSTWAIRLWGSIWVGLTGVFVYLIANRLSNKRIALLSSFLFILISSLPQIEGFTANAEIFANLPSTTATYYLLKRNWKTAGSLAGLSFLMKPTGGTILILGLILLILYKETWKPWGEYLISFAFILFIPFFYAALSIGYREYLFAIFSFRFSTVSNNFYLNLINSLSHTYIVWLPLIVTYLISCVYKKISSEMVILLCWLGTSIFGASISGYWNYHYYIQIIPPLVIIGSVSLGLLHQHKSKLFLPMVLSNFLIPFLILGYSAILHPLAGSWYFYHRPGYLIAEDVANYIRERTNPEDPIYVAFSEADIYYLSDRRSVTTSIFRNYLLERPGEYSKIVSSLSRKLPKYVLILDKPILSLDANSEFDHQIRMNYHIESHFNGYPLYARS